MRCGIKALYKSKLELVIYGRNDFPFVFSMDGGSGIQSDERTSAAQIKHMRIGLDSRKRVNTSYSTVFR